MSRKSEPDVMYQPQPGFQMAAHERLEDIITIGGTKGPGKTQVLIGESLRQVSNAHYHGIFFRRVYPSLMEIIDRCHGMFPRLGAKWQGDVGRYTFPTGAKIEFSHLQHEEDKRKHQGKEYTAQFWDQLEEFTESQFDYLLATNRTSWPGLRCYVMASHNPGGIGQAWVNRRFVKDKIPGQTYFDSAVLPDGRIVRRSIVFIRGRLEENKKLLDSNPQYVTTLHLLPDKLKKAFLDGNYDILEGMYFETWDTGMHVIRPFKVPESWRVYMSMDWGYSKPMSVHWWAVPPEMNHCYCIAEWYKAGVTSPDAAREIHEKNKAMFGGNYISSRRVYACYHDPSMRSDRSGSGRLIAEDFEDVWQESHDGRMQKLVMIPADNSRVSGWNVFRNMLEVQADGLPFCQWFGTCTEAIRTIPEMVHDVNHPEDVDTDGEDHAIDDHRYFFISRFGANKIIRPEPYDHLKGKDDMSYREWKGVHANILNKRSTSLAARVAAIGQ